MVQRVWKEEEVGKIKGSKKNGKEETDEKTSLQAYPQRVENRSLQIL